MTFNRKQFFTGFRELIDPTIEQTQVDGLNFLLGKMESDPFWVHAPQIAYALATVYHETAGSMQPVEEGFYLEAKHGKAYLKRFQKSLRYFPYFGRGYVQLTWKKNYEKAEAEFGHDLVKHPENALDPNVAYLVLTYGMHQGWFTGKKLDDYIKGAKKDYVNARRIVNGIDKAGLIAGYAKSFEEILTDSTTVPATDGSLIKSNSIQNTANDGSQGQSSIDSTDPSGAAPGATSNDKDLSPQLVDKEKPSTFVKWITGIKVGVGALIASLSAYCGGSEVQNLVATKAVENADSSVISLVILIAVITIVLIAIGILLIWIASIFYDRSAARANLLNQQKVEKAASQTENTVEYKK